jgi:predicted transcriptional regulator
VDEWEANDSGAFIEFALSAILDATKAQDIHIDKHKVEHRVEHRDERLSDAMISILKALEAKSLSRKEIFAAIGMSADFRAFKRIVAPLLTDGYIEMTVPDKPSSKLQKYRLANKGKAALQEDILA